MDRPCSLYRLYDFDGHLLYVGVTIRPHDRIVTHRRVQSWGQHIIEADFTTYPSEHDARTAEHRAIASERPIYNRQRPTPERLAYLEGS